MGNLVLNIGTQKVYFYDENGNCIGYVCRDTSTYRIRHCFNFKKKYTIRREAILSPKEVARNEAELTTK